MGLAQANDLAHYVDLGGFRAAVGIARAVPQTVPALFLVEMLPSVDHLPADPEVAAGSGHVAGDLLGVLQDRQAVLGPPLELPLTRRVL